MKLHKVALGHLGQFTEHCKNKQCNWCFCKKTKKIIKNNDAHEQKNCLQSSFVSCCSTSSCFSPSPNRQSLPMSICSSWPSSAPSSWPLEPLQRAQCRRRMSGLRERESQKGHRKLRGRWAELACCCKYARCRKVAEHSWHLKGPLTSWLRCTCDKMRPAKTKKTVQNRTGQYKHGQNKDSSRLLYLFNWGGWVGWRGSQSSECDREETTTKV